MVGSEIMKIRYRGRFYESDQMWIWEIKKNMMTWEPICLKSTYKIHTFVQYLNSESVHVYSGRGTTR